MIEVRPILSDESDATFEQLETLLENMYSFMLGKGLNIHLSVGGAKILSDSVRKTAGRNNYLVGAFDTNEMIGFGMASLRVTPPYLGNIRVGAITHIFVLPEKRRSNAGKLILDKMEKWLLEKEVHSIELEVLFHNEIGIDFWKNNMYKEELIKMRKYL